ncbi:MAG: hypothetical protein FWF02_09900 [Micrococcales bacterium]|nr:hypothetical protein [Micrococcales bacterium]MCL2668001.1 hypothetical protein [Micrococcales bacterium]
METKLSKMSALELADLERLVSEADQLVAQWLSAAPCPDHGGASLTLGCPGKEGSVFSPFTDPVKQVHQRTRDELKFGEYSRPLVFAVACCVCGRITGTFADARGTLEPCQPGQSTYLAEIRAHLR